MAVSVPVAPAASRPLQGGALLVVVAPAGAETGHVSGETVLAGLPLDRRTDLAAQRAGFTAIRRVGRPAGIHAGDPVADRGMAGARAGGMPEGPHAARPPTEAASASPPAAQAGEASVRRIVVVPAHVVPQPAWLRELRDMPLAPETAALEASGVAVVSTRHPARVLGAAEHARSAGDVAAALRDLFTVVPLLADARGRFPLVGHDAVARAERWLLDGLVKSNESFMSRHFERRISLAITRQLVRTGVTPNAMTLVSVAVGVAGAAFFLSADAVAQLAGALLFLAHSILDGCDGEIARLKFLESRGGAVLDFWGDNIVHVAVFACMAAGWSQEAATGWPLLLGAAAVAGTLASATLASRSFIDREPLASASALGRLTAALSGRDFIYLIVALAVLGKAWWVLAMTAVGSPLFVLLLWLARRSGR